MKYEYANLITNLTILPNMNSTDSEKQNIYVVNLAYSHGTFYTMWFINRAMCEDFMSPLECNILRQNYVEQI